MAGERAWLRTRRIVAAVLAGSVLTLSACSAEGRIETDDNGVKVGGDVDAKP
jgi:hypothetical protein